MELVGTILLVIVLCVAIFFLAILPGRIAKRRGHPNCEAISLCGVVGLILWPAWFVAMIWAYTKKNA